MFSRSLCSGGITNWYVTFPDDGDCPNKWLLVLKENWVLIIFCPSKRNYSCVSVLYRWKISSVDECKFCRVVTTIIKALSSDIEIDWLRKI